MRIVLIGRGKMGTLIRETAAAAGDEIEAAFGRDDLDQLGKLGKAADVVMDFSRPAALPEINTGDVVVTNLRHYEALSRALDDIRRVQDGLHTNLPNDLVSQDLRECLFHLAEITGGEITTDEVLGNIFKNFCIGK